MLPFLKIVHNKPDSSAQTILNNYVTQSEISFTSEAKKNRAIITLVNRYGSLNALDFKLEDNILIYLDTTPITTQSPIMTALITKIEHKVDGSHRYIKLTCNDKTGVLLSKAWAMSYTSQNPKKVNQVIENVIGHTNPTGGTQITVNNVASTKSDGSAFTVDVNMTKIWKPVYEWIQDLSNTEYTGEDRSYVFYVDYQNDLHWSYPFQKPDIYLDGGIDDSVTTINVDSTSGYPDNGILQIEYEQIKYTGKTGTSFTGCTRGFGETDAVAHSTGILVSAQVVQEGRGDVLNFSIGKENDNSYNFVIYNAGATPEGYEYLWYKIDPSNEAKDFKMIKVDWKDISLNMKTDEYNKDPTKWDDSRDMTYPNAYPWTTSWGVACANDGAYYDAFIAEQIRRGDERAMSKFLKTGQAKFSSDIELKGTMKYQINEICTVISATQNVIKKLRIKDIRHLISKSGWSTTINLKEDEDALSND